MIEPVKYNLRLYEGATFGIEFQIMDGGDVTDVTDWIFSFRAAATVNDAPIFDLRSDTSPNYFAVDGEFLISLSIPASMTTIAAEQLYYEIDAELPNGDIQRRLIGQIEVMRGL